MISSYLNQTVTWSQRNTQNSYGEWTYDDTLIKARKQPHSKLVIDQQGREVVSNSRVYTKEEIAVGDLIDGRRIITISNGVGFDGSEEYRRGNLE